MTVSKESIAACIAQRMSIDATAAKLGITAWRARKAAFDFGLRWKNDLRPCPKGHPREARRFIGGRARCGLCYDASNGALAERRRVLTQQAAPRKPAPKPKAKPQPVDMTVTILALGEQLERAMTPWEREEIQARLDRVLATSA